MDTHTPLDGPAHQPGLPLPDDPGGPAPAWREPSPQVWLARAVERVSQVWARRGRAYRRHLERQALPVDALDDLLTLAARRELPLEPPRHRLLPRSGLSAPALAVARLVRPDRMVLRDALAGRVADDQRLDHAAAALFRLAHNEQTARRWSDAPSDAAAAPDGVSGMD